MVKAAAAAAASSLHNIDFIIMGMDACHSARALIVFYALAHYDDDADDDMLFNVTTAKYILLYSG